MGMSLVLGGTGYSVQNSTQGMGTTFSSLSRVHICVFLPLDSHFYANAVFAKIRFYEGKC